jgi:hypothetical protein
MQQKNPEKAVMIWSGGKDSALALHEVTTQGGYEVAYLLTTANEHHGRVSMHGVRVSLLELQARALGLPFQLGERVFRRYGPDPADAAAGDPPGQAPPAFDTGFWFCDLLPV